MKKERKKTIPEDFSSKTGAVIRKLFEKNTPQGTTVVKKTTVVPDSGEEVKKTTVVKRTAAGKTNTVVLKNTVEFIPYDKIFNEDETNYWFKYTVILHWLMDNLLPKLKSRTSSVYLRLIRLAYGIKKNKGVCKVGYTALGKSSGITKKYVGQAIKELASMRAIEILGTENKGTRGGGSTYRIFIPKDSIEIAVNKSTVVKKNTVVLEDPIIYDDDNINDISNHHQESIKKFYEDITGNTWTKDDDDSYLKIKDFDLENTEQAIRIAFKRAKSHPNSFEFFIKQIQRFENPSEEERKRFKKELGEIVNFTRQVRVGGEHKITLQEDVKRRCEKEGVFFDEGLYQEIIDESYHGHWEPR